MTPSQITGLFLMGVILACFAFYAIARRVEEKHAEAEEWRRQAFEPYESNRVHAFTRHDELTTRPLTVEEYTQVVRDFARKNRPSTKG